MHEIRAVDEVAKKTTQKVSFRKSKLKDQLQLQSFVWPGLIFVLIFAYIPMYGNIIAFKEYDMITGFGSSPWVGLKYFKEFFTDANFSMVLRNTLGINLMGLVISFPATIIFALFLNEIKFLRFKKVVQTISYLPYFVSWTVFGGIILNLLSPTNGLVNVMLQSIGLIKDPIDFIGRPNYFWAIMVIASLIKGIGWGSIIYIAAITGVDQELYESARIDGANRIQQMIKITLPCIAPTVSIMFIFAVSAILNSGYEQTIILQNPLNLEMSEVIDTYVYKVGIKQMNYSYATAVGFAKSVIALILLVSANFLSKKINEDSGLF